MKLKIWETWSKIIAFISGETFVDTGTEETKKWRNSLK